MKRGETKQILQLKTEGDKKISQNLDFRNAVKVKFSIANLFR